MCEVKVSFDWHKSDDNETAFITTPLVLSFCNIYRKKISQCLKKVNSRFRQFLCNLRRITRKILEDTDVDTCFYHNNLDIALIDIRIVRVSKSCNKKIAFNLFQF